MIASVRSKPPRAHGGLYPLLHPVRWKTSLYERIRLSRDLHQDPKDSKQHPVVCGMELVVVDFIVDLEKGPGWRSRTGELDHLEFYHPYLRAQ